MSSTFNICVGVRNVIRSLALCVSFGLLRGFQSDQLPSGQVIDQFELGSIQSLSPLKGSPSIVSRLKSQTTYCCGSYLFVLIIVGWMKWRVWPVICKKALRNLGFALRSIHSFTNIKAIIVLYTALVRSQLECNAFVWANHEK